MGTFLGKIFAHRQDVESFRAKKGIFNWFGDLPGKRDWDREQLLFMVPC
jgi:hypothetical protein